MALEIRIWSSEDIEQLAAMPRRGPDLHADSQRLQRHPPCGRRHPVSQVPDAARAIQAASCRAQGEAAEAAEGEGRGAAAEDSAQGRDTHRHDLAISAAGKSARRCALHRRLFDPGDPLPLIHLGRCQCRYAVAQDKKVLGGWLFCAQPTEPEESYCAVHREMIQAPNRK